MVEIDGPVGAAPRAAKGQEEAFAALVSPSARATRLWTGGEWVEGPVQLPEGDVLFSDIPNDRVMRWAVASGEVSVDLQPAGFANGHTLDAEGRLIRCEHGRRRVSRVEPDGAVACVVDRYEGHRFNSPNDVVVDSRGAIWFTDPPYGIISDREGHKAESELGDNYVFRFEPGSGDLAIVSDFAEDPNGLAFSPDETVLYVSDTSAARVEGGNHEIVAFDVVDGRALDRPRVFAVIEHGVADGLRVDVAGNVFTSSAAGILVYSPAGALLGVIPVPETVSNCVFGGPNGHRLFITASTSLYIVDVLSTAAGVAARRP
jgi:gluconolactonase